MNNNTTNEGVVNNSNQPSQTEKLSEMINNRITSLTEKIGKISSEISELKTIEVKPEITKLTCGSTEFNIQDFMSEPDIHKYKNWLELKKELEEKSDDEIDNLIESEQEEEWKSDFKNFIQDNFHWSDIDDIDYFYDWYDFVNDYMNDPDGYGMDRFKDEFISGLRESETLQEYIQRKIEN